MRHLGYKKASKILEQMLPQSKTARSGHVGEILATEVVPVLFPSFSVPIRRLRWLDGRESALRGEDLIGISPNKGGIRFLKGESKSRVSITPSVVSAARRALRANKGRPSQHAMAYVMERLMDLGEQKLALVFEQYLLDKTILVQDLVHLIFAFSENDASRTLADDLKAYDGKIEQHAINFSINDHQQFIKSIYENKIRVT